MLPTGTQFNYYIVCHRKLWLFSHGVGMEHTSGLVDEGREIHEHAYPQRAAKWQELDLGVAKIDYYDVKQRVVHEIKKSPVKEEAHIMQVKYYLYLMHKLGIKDASGIIEYPEMRETVPVKFDDSLIGEIENSISSIASINAGACPGLLAKSRCRNCSYEDFCWSGESES